MKAISNHNCQSINPVLSATRGLFECSNTDELREQALCLMEKAFRIEKAVFYMTKSSEQRTHVDLSRIVAHGFEEKDSKLYRQYYHKLSPAYVSLKRENFSPKALVFTIDQIISYDNLVRTEFYNDYLKACNVHFELIVYLKSGNRLIGIMGMWRPAGAANFSSEDKKAVELIYPIISGALERAICLEQNSELESIIDFIIRDLPWRGIVVLDDSLEPVYMNENAINAMSSFCEHKERPRGLPLGIPNGIYRRCHELINDARMNEKSEHHQQLSQLITNEYGQELLMRINCVRDVEKPLKYFVFFEPREPILFLFQYLFKLGLTRRESEISYLVLQGLTNVEISRKLCISRYTVENHLRSVFEKMDVPNRTSLAYRMTRLALQGP